MLIIFSGTIGRSVTGGQAWANLQYLLGLQALGHQVYYLEDCGEWSVVYNWEKGEATWELDYPAAYVKDCLEPYGFGDKWIYRAGEKSMGMDSKNFLEACSQADILILRAVPLPTWRAEYNLPQRRAFIDVDPGFTQFRLIEGSKPELGETIAHCETLFTIGQHIGSPNCPIPTCNRTWRKTVSPVFLPHWPVAESPATHFTSIVRWHQREGIEDITYEGVVYGQRDREFPKFFDLPRLSAQPFKVALIGAEPKLLSQSGWEVVPGWVESRTPASYQRAIQDSRAEFGAAKHCYVSTQGGWFSDRSICYLASGRPVLAQDTGLGDWLPVGKGVVTFRDITEALQGIAAINADYEEHRQAARAIAEAYFSTEQVLPSLLAAAIA
jgi:hypothetical protein